MKTTKERLAAAIQTPLKDSLAFYHTSLKGLDSLLSIVQMPGGIPVATTAIGKSGAKNAGILAARMLGITNESVQNNLENYEKYLVAKVEEMQNELQ